MAVNTNVMAVTARLLDKQCPKSTTTTFEIYNINVKKLYRKRSKSVLMAQHPNIASLDEAGRDRDEIEVDCGPMSNRFYYAGINYYWSLVATTARNPRLLQRYNPMEPYSVKRISCVGVHAIVDLWDTFARTIAPLNTAKAWLLLSCYRIGHTSNADAPNPVVALLHVRAGMLSATDGEALAARILLEYQNLLRLSISNSISTVPTELTVEIAEILPCSDNDNNGIPCDGPPYSQNARPGSSIGYRNSESSGSIAAFFEATLNNGEIIKVLLTNHHVASPDANQRFLPRWDSECLHDILSPSPQDIKTTRDYHIATIKSLKLRTDRIQARDTSQLTSEARQELDNKVLGFQAEIKTHESILPILFKENAMWAIASLAETSGWRSDQDGCQMDWGVAILNQNISFSNELPKWEFTNREKFLKNVIAENFPDPFPSSITAISHVPLQADDMVIKYGRTTGWTLGVVNGCGTYHFKWQSEGELSKSISIVDYGGVPFCDHGDSGSMILNTEGEAAALLFAINKSAQESVNGLTFAADIRATIADIERQTPLKNMKLLS